MLSLFCHACKKKSVIFYAFFYTIDLIFLSSTPLVSTVLSKVSGYQFHTYTLHIIVWSLLAFRVTLCKVWVWMNWSRRSRKSEKCCCDRWLEEHRCNYPRVEHDYPYRRPPLSIPYNFLLNHICFLIHLC